MNPSSHGQTSPPLQQPLRGVQVLEFEGLGPVPLAGHLLQSMGARVTLVARPQASAVGTRLSGGAANPLEQGKTRVMLDLKQPAGRAQALDLVAGADVVLEGLRPGVMERLGLGPADCAARNPRLVYGRMTGWGQQGPLAHAAGHDLNYVALSGLLALASAPGQPPRVPPTVVGDAGGALGLCFGVVCAVLRARQSGQGSVVDAAIVDVVAMLGGLAHWIRAGGQLDSGRPSVFHDAPFYDSYACADGGFITLGALEPQFYAELLRRLELHDVDPAAQHDTASWPALKQRFANLFKTRSRDAWCAVLEGSDACFAPVLGVAEAASHPHNVARGTFTVLGGGQVAARAAPRFLPLQPAVVDACSTTPDGSP